MSINSQVNEVGLRGNILFRRDRMLRGKGEKQYLVCARIYNTPYSSEGMRGKEWKNNKAGKGESYAP